MGGMVIRKCGHWGCGHWEAWSLGSVFYGRCGHGGAWSLGSMVIGSHSLWEKILVKSRNHM